MANIINVFWVIAAFAVYNIHAAALQQKQINDLDELATKEGDQTAASYRPIEPEHLTVNESKVIIDLYTPQNPHELIYSDELKNETAKKPALPFVQLVINQPEADGSNQSTVEENDGDSVQINENQTTEHIRTTSSSLQLIPPALVSPAIAQLKQESKQKQGQIIIRYDFFFSSLNIICTRFVHTIKWARSSN